MLSVALQDKEIQTITYSVFFANRGFSKANDICVKLLFCEEGAAFRYSFAIG